MTDVDPREKPADRRNRGQSAWIRFGRPFFTRVFCHLVPPQPDICADARSSNKHTSKANQAHGYP